MIIADLIAKTLVTEGITHVFTYAGGTVSFLIDAIKRAGINIIICRHEQACAFAASAFSKSECGLGCCIATSGPGALNLITGIADAYYDYTPMLVITGQCGSEFLNPTDIQTRQHGFQYTDITKVCEPITVFRYELNTYVDVLPYAIECAKQFNGPALVSIPIDIQRSTV
jgi:acetolactate synthase I/II/III large subunit